MAASTIFDLSILAEIDDEGQVSISWANNFPTHVDGFDEGDDASLEDLFRWVNSRSTPWLAHCARRD